MIELGCGIEIKNRKEAYKTFRSLILNNSKIKELGEISFDYVHTHIGATEKIIFELDYINKKGG